MSIPACLFAAVAARAEEGGTGHRLPGSGVFLVGILPPKPGLTVKFSNWYFDGSIEAASPLSDVLRSIVENNNGIGGVFGSVNDGGRALPPSLAGVASALATRVAATDVKLTVDSTLNVSAFSLIYEVPWKPLGGRYAVGVALPFLYVDTQVTIEVRGPKRTRTAKIEEHDFGFSDMVIFPGIIGWDHGNWHWNFGFGIYAPTGAYSPNDLAPLGKNFWTFEPFAGLTYLNQKYGQEVSLAVAFDFNTENPATNYRSGDQLLIEWLIAQHLPYGFSLGVTGFLYQQVTGDSGSGAKNGSSLAGTYAIGPSVGYTWKDKLSISAQWLYEFEVNNRFEGYAASLIASWTF